MITIRQYSDKQILNNLRTAPIYSFLVYNTHFKTWYISETLQNWGSPMVKWNVLLYWQWGEVTQLCWSTVSPVLLITETHIMFVYIFSLSNSGHKSWFPYVVCSVANFLNSAIYWFQCIFVLTGLKVEIQFYGFGRRETYSDKICSKHVYNQSTGTTSCVCYSSNSQCRKIHYSSQ